MLSLVEQVIAARIPSKHVVAQREMKEEALRLMLQWMWLKGENVTISSVASGMSINQSTARARLMLLHERGRINKFKRGDTFYWSLTDAERRRQKLIAQ